MNFDRNQTLGFALLLLARAVVWSLGDQAFLGANSPDISLPSGVFKPSDISNDLDELEGML